MLPALVDSLFTSVELLDISDFKGDWKELYDIGLTKNILIKISTMTFCFIQVLYKYNATYMTLTTILCQIPKPENTKTCLIKDVYTRFISTCVEVKEQSSVYDIQKCRIP